MNTEIDDGNCAEGNKTNGKFGRKNCYREKFIAQVTINDSIAIRM